MYTKRLTAEQINSAVTAETVNSQVDLSAVFDVTRASDYIVGFTSQVNFDVTELGLYYVEMSSDQHALSASPSVLVLISQNQSGEPVCSGGVLYSDDNVAVQAFRHGSGNSRLGVWCNDKTGSGIKIIRVRKVG